VAKSKRTILRVGITGGIGSGKSLVCSLFEREGIPVLYADEIARELGDTDLKIKKAIRKLLGDDVYQADGTLNRPLVASRVFTNKSLQKGLNKIVHPAVEREIDAKIKGLEQTGKRLVLVEAALIYEARLDKNLDYIIVVEADEKLRIERIIARDKTTAEEVRDRMNSQWKGAEKVKRADFVLYNNLTKEELVSRVAFLLTLLRQLST
jgi:dephospho-CoA kinase